MTGVLSMLLFGTQLSVMYGLGIINVIVAVLLYNGRRETLERFVC
jgi:drug/metabolite transporter (DMT)-like permease